MTPQEKKALRAQYSKKLTLNNVRCILHISKRKASWLLANGYIKCKNNGKKTRQYSIDIKDLFTYIDTAETRMPCNKNTFPPIKCKICMHHIHSQTFHGAWPEAHILSNCSFSRTVSIHCQKPSWRYAISCPSCAACSSGFFSSTVLSSAI